VVNVNVGDHYGRQKRWSAGVAMLLSFLIPGVGQMYKGQALNGIAWLIVVVIGYALFVVPGLILHICCIIGAGMGDPYKR
jgi:TM2 domain-containing membrane protein YozV